jgi:hypothetical protein
MPATDERLQANSEGLAKGTGAKRRLTSYWPIAIIGLSAAATLLWMGILALLIRALITAI